MTPEQRKTLRNSYKSVKFSDIMDFFESLPRDMLFAMRVGNLVRGIHKDLGGDIFTRFFIQARYAVKGCFSIPMAEREALLFERVEHLRRVGLLSKPVSSPLVVPPVLAQKLSWTDNDSVYMNSYVGLSLFAPFTLVRDILGIRRVVLFLRDYVTVSLRLWIGYWVMNLINRVK
jgi:hypothetical protein